MALQVHASLLHRHELGQRKAGDQQRDQPVPERRALRARNRQYQQRGRDRKAASGHEQLPAGQCTVALFQAHRAGDEAAVRALFTRMLPILNVQAVFRWSLTKHVLKRRGLIASTHQRTSGPRIDALDAADVDAFLADLADLLPALPR